MAFLVQMGESGRLNVDIKGVNQITLEIWWVPFSHHLLPSSRHQSHILILSTQTINQEKNEESRNEIQISTNCILLPWLMHTKPSATRGRFGTQS